MSRRKIIILITTIAAMFLCVTAFAAFVITFTIAGTATTGDVTVSEKSFLTYGQNEYTKVADNQSYSPIALYYTRSADTLGTAAKPHVYTPAVVTEENYETLKSTLYVRTTSKTRTSVPNVLNSSSITCYASEKGGYSEEREYPYLKQIGLKFSFKPTIAVYLRIHIEDAWISQKIYNNGTAVESYVKKGTLNNTSPFTPADTTNWFYDESTNCVYYKHIIDPNSDTFSSITNANGEIAFTFNVGDYMYTSGETHNYREAIMVQVSFFVDIVQANRAEQKWDVKLSDYQVA